MKSVLHETSTNLLHGKKLSCLGFFLISVTHKINLKKDGHSAFNIVVDHEETRIYVWGFTMKLQLYICPVS